MWLLRKLGIERFSGGKFIHVVVTKDGMSPVRGFTERSRAREWARDNSTEAVPLSVCELRVEE